MTTGGGYLAHWGLAEAPFLLEPDPRFAYERADHREGLARILFGITQLGGIVVITGEIGAGKTLLSQTLRGTLDGEGFHVAEVANPPRTAAALLSSILLAAEGPRAGGSAVETSCTTTALPSASAESIAGSRLGSFIDRRSCAKKRCLVPSNTESAADLAPEFRVSPLSVSTIRVASSASRRLA